MERKRDFHLQQDPARPQEQPWFASGDPQAHAFWLPGGDGYDLVEDLAKLLRESPEFQAHIVAELRRYWWHLRNQKFTNVVKLSDAISFILDVRFLLVKAGMAPFDVEVLNKCLANACTCDGCDLANGKRVQEIMREANKKPPHGVQAIGGVAEEQSGRKPNGQSAC